MDRSNSATFRRVTAVIIAVVAGVSLFALVADVLGRDDSDSATLPAVAPPTTAPLSTLPATTSTSTTTTSTTTTLPVQERILSALIGEMSLERKAQQLLVIGGPGGDLIATIEAAMGSPCVGGVFVTGNQANWTPQDDPVAAQASIELLALGAADCAIRPLFSTDAEAGTRVLKVPVDPLDSPRSLVADFGADPAATIDSLSADAESFAEELSAIGIHLNLGVIVDVDVSSDHYMARQRRSFGGDPAVVTELSTALVEGHCRARVAAAIKHFPNQGATLADPHQGDSVSSNDFDEWLTLGRLPYVATAAPVVMTGHVRYVDVDESTPASLSRVITSGWLRDDLGYDGVVITDDLHGMRGVTEEASAGGRAVAAIDAGADLALFVSPSQLSAIVDAIVERASNDPTFSARVDESVDRVLRLKAAFGLVDGLDPEWFPICG